MSDDSDSPTLFGKKKVRVLGPREDWAYIPLSICLLLGILVSFWDFYYIQGAIFQTLFVLVGGSLFIVGVIFYLLVIFSLNKAAMGDILTIKILQIAEGQQLLTDGYYKHIRHPAYLGVVLWVSGLPIACSSLYGFSVMVMAILFLNLRIRIEEKMLIDAFGEEYKEYQKRTKKLIPFLY